MQYKLINWSYPTSENARRFGFNKSGCWTVSVVSTKISIPIAVFASQDKNKAIEHANKLKAVWLYDVGEA